MWFVWPENGEKKNLHNWAFKIMVAAGPPPLINIWLYYINNGWVTSSSEPFLFGMMGLVMVTVRFISCGSQLVLAKVIWLWVRQEETSAV